MAGTDEATVDDDLRGDIEAALGDDTPEGDLGGQEPGTSAVETGGTSKPELDATNKGAPTRDSMGRFLPKDEKAAIPAPAAPPGTQPIAQAPITQPATAQPAAQAIPAPAGWGFNAREAWAQLPAAVQQEVARREGDMQRFVNESAPARQLGEQFWTKVQPYMSAIRAEGVDPITAVDNLLQFGARMRMGTPVEKAQTLARIVKAYGVNIADLDSALVGQDIPAQSANGHDPQAVQQAVQEALAPLYQAAQQRQQALQQSAETHTRSELEAFAADPAHKYLHYLRPIMADLIEGAQRRGGDMSLEDAYQRAGMLHPEVSKVMIAQRQGVNAQQLTAAAQRARAAAVSVNGAAPIGNPNPAEPTSIRESIEAAIEAHSRY